MSSAGHMILYISFDPVNFDIILFHLFIGTHNLFYDCTLFFYKITASSTKKKKGNFKIYFDDIYDNL